MPADEARQRLSLQQAAFVRALVADGAAPADFDPVQLQVASAALFEKRWREAAHAWPGLAHELGAAFQPHFRRYAADSPLPERGGPAADGRQFATWLARQGFLLDAGRLEALVYDLHREPRFFQVRWVCLHRLRRVVVAIRLPLLGSRWCALPFGWSRQHLAQSTSASQRPGV